MESTNSFLKPVSWRTRFGLRTLLILVAICGMLAAWIAQPIYRYRMEQTLVHQIGAVQFDPNPAVLIIS